MAAHITPESEILYTQDEYIDLYDLSYTEAESTDGGEGEVASSCPSSWLKEVNLLSPLPTDTTRRCPSEAGGEGRILRGLLSSNGALGAGVEGEGDPPDPRGAGSMSDTAQTQVRHPPNQAFGDFPQQDFRSD